MTSTETRHRIAVFIDFDNVEIGVKSTIGGQFDIGLVLEAIKERGEIVTKIAYSDWKRVGDYSRLLTQHAIRMVQRNMTPGGDKNGADITMALDALEMAFTHDHINAFVIVGGDSDFISLVEKLKQYGRKVIVVGGRQFTSVTMQKNCHEFIAYENLVGTRGRPAERGGRPAATSDIAKALPIVKRALKVLSEREVTPQLGLLKSTLLQLDSTFSEREYGAGSFRDFMEKVAQAGAVTLKHAGRSMLVEPREEGVGEMEDLPAAADRVAEVVTRQPAPAPAPMPDVEDEDEESLPASPMTMQDGIRAVQRAIHDAPTPPRFPMYVRQAKQFLRNAIEGFDERKYGFASVVDLLRAAGKEGVLRIERDRQGAVRVFPGPNLAVKPAVPRFQEPVDLDETIDVEVPQQAVVDAPVIEDAGEPVIEEVVDGPSIVEAESVQEVPDEETAEEVVVEEKPRRTRARKTTGARAQKTAKPRARKSARTSH
ncbi:MAG TPA: NYN domain-containing protein [Vicinamibacterales bacterium]|nr:NYN domain-containing protein [Vicinamibacterales bacterium]